jgi:succinate dehydrogenase/fumarate reductase flavoprotein subunit
VTVKEYLQAEDIVVEDGRATGVLALDARTNSTARFAAGAVVLATGGVGQLFRVSTNPDIATGVGIALAYRAGAEVRDMEFVQFHPTALRMPGVPIFLISEAVRGEGGLLRNKAGERFMPGYDERAELRPRPGPDAGTGAGIARGALHDGRRAHERLGRNDGAGAIRLRRVRLHRRARRQPPRQQLAPRDGGLRAARGGAHRGIAGHMRRTKR